MGNIGDLFVSESHALDFVLIERDMRATSDLCAALSRAESSQVRSFAHFRARLQAKEEPFILGGQDRSQVMIDYLDSEIAKNQGGFESTVTAASLMLVFAFYERALQRIALRLAPSKGELKRCIRQHKWMGKIAAYHQYLQTTLSSPLSTLQGQDDMFAIERGLRNKFAHGRWDDETNGMHSYRDVLRSLTPILTELERTMSRRAT